jgi:hypothetical protein
MRLQMCNPMRGAFAANFAVWQGFPSKKKKPQKTVVCQLFAGHVSSNFFMAFDSLLLFVPCRVGGYLASQVLTKGMSSQSLFETTGTLYGSRKDTRH